MQVEKSANFFTTVFPARDLFAFYAARCDEAGACRSENREFCVEGDEWRRRFQEAASADAFAALVTKSKGVRALHAGAVFSERVSLARRPGVVPLHKELVFDLDLQDFPWLGGDKNDMAHNDLMMPTLFASANILKVVLEEAFGFGAFMLVYSGRRGVHLYCLDRRAFELVAEARKAICAFVSLPSRSADSPFLDTRLHPSLNTFEIHEAIDAAWSVAEQLLFSSRLSIMKFASNFCLFKPFESKKNVAGATGAAGAAGKAGKAEAAGKAGKAEAAPPPRRALPSASAVIAEMSQCLPEERMQRLGRLSPFAAQDLKLSVVWPRLDAEVTSSMNHTVKTPFSLHAKTSRVALPISVSAFQDGWLPKHAEMASPEFADAFENGVDMLRRATKRVRGEGILKKRKACFDW